MPPQYSIWALTVFPGLPACRLTTQARVMLRWRTLLPLSLLAGGTGSGRLVGCFSALPFLPLLARWLLGSLRSPISALDYTLTTELSALYLSCCRCWHIADHSALCAPLLHGASSLLFSGRFCLPVVCGSAAPVTDRSLRLGCDFYRVPTVYCPRFVLWTSENKPCPKASYDWHAKWVNMPNKIMQHTPIHFWPWHTWVRNVVTSVKADQQGRREVGHCTLIKKKVSYELFKWTSRNNITLILCPLIKIQGLANAPFGFWILIPVNC